MRYFQNFPIITYNSQRVRDITRRVKVLQQTKNYKTLFYSYVVKDGERPDIIANDYYGDSYYDVVINLVNTIVDPYFEWPLTQTEFEAYLEKKYGSVEEAQALILHYKKNDDTWYVSKRDSTTVITDTAYAALTMSQKADYEEGTNTNVINISTQTYDGLDNPDKADYSPVYAYDYEFVTNEAKRKIKLLNLNYISLFEKDFINKMKA